VVFTVGVSGGPAAYRWFKDTVLQSSTSNTLNIANAQVSSAGSYQVVITNVLGAVTSTVATLTVNADTDGPKMLEAIINNVPAGGGSPFGTNTINVSFVNNEPLNAISARNTNNYQLVSATNSSIRIPILSILYSTALGALINVDGSNANWRPSGDYYLIVNNVADSKGNNIAPNSVIGVSVLVTTNLTQMMDPWDFYSISFFDPTFPDIYRNAGTFATNPWYGTNFVVDYSSGLWGNGSGILYVDPNPPPTQICAGDTPQTLISYQNQPTLFRRKFTLPAGLPRDGTLRFRFVYDDGIVVYLNGVELFRRNMPAGTLNELTSALTSVTDFACVTNLSLDVTGLNVAPTTGLAGRPNAITLSGAGFKDGDVRLLLARALERSGDVSAAEGAYAEALKVFRGEEARYRYAAMLKSLGQTERANVLYREVINNAERSPRFYQDAQSDWIKAAKRDLAA